MVYSILYIHTYLCVILRSISNKTSPNTKGMHYFCKGCLQSLFYLKKKNRTRNSMLVTDRVPKTWLFFIFCQILCLVDAL